MPLHGYTCSSTDQHAIPQVGCCQQSIHYYIFRPAVTTFLAPLGVHLLAGVGINTQHMRSCRLTMVRGTGLPPHTMTTHYTGNIRSLLQLYEQIFWGTRSWGACCQHDVQAQWSRGRGNLDLECLLSALDGMQYSLERLLHAVSKACTCSLWCCQQCLGAPLG